MRTTIVRDQDLFFRSLSSYLFALLYKLLLHHCHLQRLMPGVFPAVLLYHQINHRRCLLGIVLDLLDHQ